jgi:hypothetical protein
LINKVDGLIGATTVHVGRFTPQAFATRASAWIEEASSTP